jgi:hypothetical protein
VAPPDPSADPLADPVAVGEDTSPELSPGCSPDVPPDSSVSSVTAPPGTVRSVVLPSPRMVIWLPEASTGAAAVGEVWFPEPVPSWPLVVSPPVVFAASAGVVLSLVLPSPITVTWLAPASTGATAVGEVWFPEPVPSWPLVVSPPELPPAAPLVPLVEPAWLPFPMTVTWLPVTSTGTTAPRPVWLPDPVPSWPLVESPAEDPEVVLVPE